MTGHQSCHWHLLQTSCAVSVVFEKLACDCGRSICYWKLWHVGAMKKKGCHDRNQKATSDSSFLLKHSLFFAVYLVIVSPCPSGEFTCTSGECFSPALVCDFKTNCEDGSDEEFCGMLSVQKNVFKTSLINVFFTKEHQNFSNLAFWLQYLKRYMLCKKILHLNRMNKHKTDDSNAFRLLNLWIWSLNESFC